MNEKRVEVIVETDPVSNGAVITRPDGTNSIADSLSHMMDEMLFVSGEYPGIVMVDKRGWKFPGEV